MDVKIKIPVYQPFITELESKYVNECLQSTWISSKGKFVDLFEREFSKYLSLNDSISVTNGTVALHLALLALNIQPGDEVLVPTFTYIASVNTIKYVGAKPVFVDSDKNTWQIDPNKMIGKITNKTKAIIAVHLYGYVCDMDRIIKIAKDNNLAIIEDCSEALGSKYNNRYAGTFGDIATFSFFGNKTITTGEGGMVSTNNPELSQKIRILKNQGIVSEKEYGHEVIGYNYRMTNICAAIGKAQLEKIDYILKKKREIAYLYFQELKKQPIYFITENEIVSNSFWMVTGKVNNKTIRDNLRKHLSGLGIETRGAFPPVHKFPFYISEDNSFPVAEDLANCGINLPSYPGLNDKDVIFICNSIKIFFDLF